jgi:hypothetical protein
MMTTETMIITAVEEVYRHIDDTVASWMQAADRAALDRRTRSLCHACGRCCDFESYDHRLFVTSAEITHLIAAVGRGNILHMRDGVCPYHLRGECTIHAYRFAGCRIFHCKADPEAQAALSEWASSRFKAICQEAGLDYSYVDLKTALNSNRQG